MPGAVMLMFHCKPNYQAVIARFRSGSRTKTIDSETLWISAQNLRVNGDQGINFWTTTESGKASNWKQTDIERFIDVSAGTVAMSMPGILNEKDAVNFTIESQYSSTELDHGRSYFLLNPMPIITAATAVLAIINSKMHHQLGIPAVRLATVGDILQSSVTESIQEAAIRNGFDPTEPSTPGVMSVRYGVCKGGVVGLGDPDVVSRFQHEGM
jgi:hypothetical protein